MFRTILSALALAALAVPGIALAKEPTTFTRDGVRYSYITEFAGDRTVLRGEVNGRHPFVLTVKGRRVTGTYNRRPVAFLLDKPYARAPHTTVAAAR